MDEDLKAHMGDLAWYYNESTTTRPSNWSATASVKARASDRLREAAAGAVEMESAVLRRRDIERTLARLPVAVGRVLRDAFTARRLHERIEAGAGALPVALLLVAELGEGEAARLASIGRLRAAAVAYGAKLADAVRLYATEASR